MCVTLILGIGIGASDYERVYTNNGSAPLDLYIKSEWVDGRYLTSVANAEDGIFYPVTLGGGSGGSQVVAELNLTMRDAMRADSQALHDAANYLRGLPPEVRHAAQAGAAAIGAFEGFILEAVASRIAPEQYAQFQADFGAIFSMGADAWYDHLSTSVAEHRMTLMRADDLAVVAPWAFGAAATLVAAGDEAAALSAELRAVRAARVTANQVAGDAREAIVRAELESAYPGANIQAETYLRGQTGRRALDPLTGKARRIDFVVIKDRRVVDSVEVTSLNANKDAQALREARIRDGGGTFIRDRVTRALIDISPVPTRTVRKP